MECSIVKIDQSYRFVLPQALSRSIGWLRGDDAVSALLLLGGPGRCRLLSEAEAESDASCRFLRSIPDAGELRSLADFDEAATETLGLRLHSVEISPPGPGWRLTIPRALAAIMQIEPKESIALLTLHKRIEIWTIGELRAAVASPLSDIIHE
jgi:hypothetical protein